MNINTIGEEAEKILLEMNRALEDESGPHGQELYDYFQSLVRDFIKKRYEIFRPPSIEEKIVKKNVRGLNITYTIRKIG